MNRAGVLWGLLFLFVLRVLGQLAVHLDGAPFLPPMGEWYSGLIPYGPLLACQVAIIVMLAWINRDITRGRGRFATPRPVLGRWLALFGWIYLGAMVVRYAVRMTVHPDARWTGGTIPIVFHCVLAAYLLVLAAHYRSGAA